MKQKSLFFSLLLIFVLAISPMLVLAQEDIEVEEYEDEDGTFSFSYPAGWVVSADIEESGALYIANSEETMAVLEAEDDTPLEEGQFGVALTFFPADLLTMMGMDAELLESEDADPEELVAAVFEFFMTMEGEEDEEDAPEFGEPELLELDEETALGVLPVTIESQNLEGVFFFYEVGDGVFALGAAGAHTGEFEDNAEALGVILGSLEVNISAEDLMAIYMGEAGAEPEETEEP